MADHTVTAAANVGGGISPSGAVTVPDGGSQLFTASPDSGWVVKDWEVDEQESPPAQVGGTTFTITNVLADHALDVSFSNENLKLSGDAVAVDAMCVKTLQPIGQPIPPKGTWKYLKTNSPPANWFKVSFDDSGWSSGPAPFGNAGSSCVLPEPIGTAWDGSTQILLRFAFTSPNTDPINNFIFGIDGIVQESFFNDGIFVGYAFPTYSPQCPHFVPSIASSPPNSWYVSGVIPNAGPNLLALKVSGNGADSWFDMTAWTEWMSLICGITGDAVAVPAEGKTISGDAFASPFAYIGLDGDAVAVSGAIPHDIEISGDAVARLAPLSPGQQNLLSKYLQQQREALLQKTCQTCAPIDCVEKEVSYSLESPEFQLVFVCPQGFDCNLIGEEFHLVCCDGTTYDFTFSPEVSQEDRKRITDAAIADCARKLAFCNIDPCPTPPCTDGIWLYWNHIVSCSTKCPDGGTFTVTIPANVYVALTQEAADRAARLAACQKAKLHRICFFGIQSVTCVGEMYDDQILVGGQFIAAFPWSDTVEIVAGALPDGIVFNDNSSFAIGGRIPLKGVPTTGGTFTFTVRITLGTPGDAFGDTSSKTYTIKVAQIQPDTLPDAKIGVAYSQNLTVIPTHDQETEKWTVVTSLPAGLSLTNAGVLHGTPTGPTESHNVTVRVDFMLDGEPQSCTKQFTLTVTEGCNETTMVPYQATDWKYSQIALGDSPPANYQTVAFDDSGFSTGQAAFGQGPDIGPPCFVQSTVHTTWTRNTQMVLRKHVTLAAGTKNVRLRFAVDNDVVALWFNGVLLASNLHHDFCPALPNYEYAAADGTVIAGDNVVAVLVKDQFTTSPPNGDQSFFDLTVVACVP